ncbi:hypothetical protein O23A_p2012 [Aeromonas salmonicida]|nr:hypothetical protein O23A_p2012 [Aeromonas salmonicida]
MELKRFLVQNGKRSQFICPVIVKGSFCDPDHISLFPHE